MSRPDERNPRARSRFSLTFRTRSGPPDELELWLNAADFSSQARAPRERSFTDIFFHDLVEQIAAEHDLAARVHPTFRDIHLFHVDQAGQSDLALIQSLATRYGAAFKPTGDSWAVMPLGATESVDGEPYPPVQLRMRDVTTYRAQHNSRAIYNAVRATWQDFGLAARRPAVYTAQGQWPEAQADAAPEPVLWLDGLWVDEDTAMAEARSAFWRKERERRELRLRLPGRVDLQALRRLHLIDFPPGVAGQWLMTHVVHDISRRGYRCEVEASGIQELSS